MFRYKQSCSDVAELRLERRSSLPELTGKVGESDAYILRYTLHRARCFTAVKDMTDIFSYTTPSSAEVSAITLESGCAAYGDKPTTVDSTSHRHTTHATFTACCLS